MVFVAERLIKVVDFRLHRSRLHLTRTGSPVTVTPVQATSSKGSQTQATLVLSKNRGPPVPL